MKRNVLWLPRFLFGCIVLIWMSVLAQSVPDKLALTPLTADKILKPGLQILLTPDQWGAQISPDGQKLVFTRSFSGTNQVWVSNVDGTGLVKLTSLEGPQAGSPRWSPDGRWIAFDVDWTTHGKVFVVSTNGGTVREITPDESSNHLVPSWSRDGKWVYFASERSGDWEVWKAPLDEGQAVQVTHQGGFAAIESLDGAYVYYSKQRYPDPEVWRIPVAGNTEEQVSPLVRPLTWADWSVTASGIYFVTVGEDARPVLQYFDFTSARNQKVAELANPSFSLSVSDDARIAVCAGKKWK